MLERRDRPHPEHDSVRDDEQAAGHYGEINPDTPEVVYCAIMTNTLC